MKLSAEQRAALVALMTKGEDALSASETEQLKALSAVAHLSGELVGIAAEVETAKAAAAAAKAKEDAKPEPAKPGMFDNAKALVADKAKLVSANAELTKVNGELKAGNAKLTAEVAALQTELAALKTERDHTAAELAKAQESAKTVSAQVTDELAAVGVAPKDLPAAQREDDNAPESEAALEAAMKGKSFTERAELRKAFENRQKANRAAAKASQN